MVQVEARGKLAAGLMAAAAFTIVVAGMREARELIVPLLLAAFVAVVCLPGIVWLERRKLPRGVAMALVLMGLVTGGGLLSGMLWKSLGLLAEQLPDYKLRLASKMEGFKQAVRHSSMPSWVRDKASPSDLIDAFDLSKALDMLGDLAGQVGGIFANGFLILLLVIFILAEGRVIRARVGQQSADPEAARARFDRTLAEINRYMGLKTLVSLMTGAIVAAWLAILGVDFPLLWGTLAFLLNFVPNLGSILAAVPPVLLAFLQGGVGMAGWAALAFLAVNTLVGNVMEPKLFGKGLGLSTLVVFLSLVFWGWVLGPMGMILSVPLTMAVKIGLESSPEGRSWASWMGPVPDPEETPPPAPVATATDDLPDA
ncbi:MAG: hypothetical protein DRQ55_09070 [Planctomycetota bacterium]|nr:MAG: hypothetical protein DRQ55_09070 [Planctomycetota bacterium]